MGAAPDLNIAAKDNEPNMLAELQKFCSRHELPLPCMEIVWQSGNPEAPQYVACCQWSVLGSSMKCYGKSDNNKEARQLAAIELLIVIAPQVLIVAMEAKADQRNVSGRCYKYLKKAALELIKYRSYLKEMPQLLAFWSAWKITPKVSMVSPFQPGTHIVKVQLNVDFENIFPDYESVISGQSMTGCFKVELLIFY